MKREKIVVVEDKRDILEVMGYNLGREGYRVVTATDGMEGLRLIRDEAPDVVLLDLMLPGLDGIEWCRRLKTDPVTKALPIIMVTAKGEEADVVLGLGVGADSRPPSGCLVPMCRPTVEPDLTPARLIAPRAFREPAFKEAPASGRPLERARAARIPA